MVETILNRHLGPQLNPNEAISHPHVFPRKRTNSLAFFLTAILLISCADIAAASRINPLDKDSPNKSSPSPTAETPPAVTTSDAVNNEIDDSTAMELYTQWLESTHGARSSSLVDHNTDLANSEGFSNFKETLTRINEINTNPNIQWTAGLTDTANLPASKHYPLMNTYVEPAPPPNATSTSRWATVVYNGSSVVDYWSTGKVTPIRSQGSCGACWAFSTIATIESKIMISGGPATDLSEQFLVNCDVASHGCEGGYLTTAMDMIQQKGVPLETDVPFVESDSGIYSSTSCSRTGATPTSTHAMTIVGFNTTSNPPYWIVRNQWSQDWGMGGYAFIQMDPDNSPGQCSMYLYSMFYPLDARLVVDANGNGVDDVLEQVSTNQHEVGTGGGDGTQQNNDATPPSVPTKCTGYGYNNFKIRGKAVIQKLRVKDYDACATATATVTATKGGIFNFSKKTKMCTVLNGSWEGISGNLVADKTMMTGFPSCLPVQS